jgi:hypothetical protein
VILPEGAEDGATVEVTVTGILSVNHHTEPAGETSRIIVRAGHRDKVFQADVDGGYPGVTLKVVSPAEPAYEDGQPYVAGDGQSYLFVAQPPDNGRVTSFWRGFGTPGHIPFSGPRRPMLPLSVNVSGELRRQTATLGGPEAHLHGHERGPFHERHGGPPARCGDYTCAEFDTWASTGRMPEGHFWYWSDSAHSSGYVGHTQVEEDKQQARSNELREH